MDIRTEERYEDDFNQGNLFIMKRSGERVPFDESKIVRAIEKANAEVTIPLEKMSEEKIEEIAAQIKRDAENAGRDLSVEEIQDKVEDSLMIAGYCTLARLYITYRYKHNLDRKKSTLDKKIESLINVKVNKDGSVSGGNEEVNQENSNKDTKVLSVQRDYMAGEWSREYTNRNLLPEDVVNAHRSGLIHVHDTDYMAQPEHNCFSSKTEFVTRNGVVSFADCKDGQVVEVLDKDGVWREATVKCYGKQKLQDVVLKKDDEEKLISCTANHRWILSDETITIALKEGDVLYGHLWKVDSITTCDGVLEDVWCVEEPVTHSFTLAGGIVTGNCCLINLEDMLQNETCISGTKIERPKSFMTASTVASQIIAQVASSQYGGQTISLAHLAPFVDISRQKILKRLSKEMYDIGIEVTEEKLKELAEKEVRKEVENGCQTLQYQLITLQTTNGQAPFVTVFMYLNEAKNEREKEDLALLIEVMFKQRMLGVKDSSGYYITPAFPKLIYCLQEDNISEDGKYWYLTELAAKCTAKRMVPDYISEKKMLELKGDVYPSMGCVDGKEVVTYKYNGRIYVEAFERMWNRLGKYFEINLQENGKDYVMKTPGVMIYDQCKGFVDNYGIIKNHNSEWLRISFSNGRTITCTKDHPFETCDNRVVYAKDLKESDLIAIDKTSDFAPEYTYSMKTNRAWLYGFTLCDSTYYDGIIASIAQDDEQEIKDMFINTIRSEYGLDVTDTERHRGVKGNYIDLLVNSDGTNTYRNLRLDLACSFEGKAKNDRHIPNEVFSWTKEAKLAFLAGMIDADGYLNTHTKKARIQIGSTNKELAIQQMLLAQSCGMFAVIYPNRYRTNRRDKIRYRVEFTPTEELLAFIQCEKKVSLHDSILENTNASIVSESTCHITKVEEISEEGFSYDVTTASEHFTVSGLYSHNCRSFLTPDRCSEKVGNIAHALNYEEGKHKYYGRFNQGVVTINLVDVACSSEGDEDKFWEILEERLNLCHKALRAKHERLLGTPSDVAPIQWQHGALARLKPGEVIDPLLFNGYSTISLGYAGLAECVYFMKHESHTSENGKEFGLKVMQALNDACGKWKAEENIDYSVYGTPLESTTYKFAKCLQKRFGKIPGVTDKNYITNSYHIRVTENINAFDKLTKEAEFQKLSPGGAISYVEVPNMQGNIPAVLAIIKHIYNTILYAELNTKSDQCEACGYNGEIQIVNKDGKLIWRCPQCGCTDQNKMHVARRTCGYIGTQYWNQGRTQEIAERVLHVSIDEDEAEKKPVKILPKSVVA